MRYLAVITIFFGVWGLLSSSVEAAGQRFEVAAEYELVEGGNLAVTKTYTVTNTASSALERLTVVTPSASLSAISARYPDGGAIPIETVSADSSAGDIRFDYQALRLEFPRRMNGQGVSWQFTLSYVAAHTLSSWGGTHSLFIPGIGQEVPEAAYGITLRYPESFGGALLLPDSARSGHEAGSRYVRLNREHLDNFALSAVFNPSPARSVTIEVPLKNRWPWPRTVKIALLPELAGQKLAVTGSEPAARNLSLDSDGNIYGHWRLGARAELTAEVTLAVETPFYRYDLAAAGTVEEVPAELMSLTAATRRWPGNSSLRQQAAEITEGTEDAAQAALALSRFVGETLKPRVEEFEPGTRSDVRDLLAGRRANALEYSDLLITLLRNHELPARLVLGQATGALVSDSGMHAWVETYIPGVGWIVLDPFWGEQFSVAAVSYPDRVALLAASGALPDSTLLPLLTGAAGLSSSELEAFAPGETAAGVVPQRWVILPGLVLNNIHIQHRSARAVDGLELTLGDKSYALGSLAPLEQRNFRRLGLGGMGAVPVTLMLGEQELAAVTTTAHWGLFWVLIGVLGLSGGVLQWRQLRKRSLPPADNPQTSPPAAAYRDEGHAAEHYHEQ